MIVHQTIYAGETPLENTITIEQTGPMQLTVSAGYFVTTGEARVFNPGEFIPEEVDFEVTENRAEYLPDGGVRAWLLDENGEVLKSSQRYDFPEASVFDLTSDVDDAKQYAIDIGTINDVPEILCYSQIAGDPAPNKPDGWELVHWLAFPIILQPGTTSLDNVVIPVFTVISGFPPGTNSTDWKVQRVITHVHRGI